MGEKENACRGLGRSPEGKRPLGRLDDNIKIGLIETG
jgi:hypothetical protein